MRALTAALLATLAVTAQPAQARRPRVGEPAPDATLTLINRQAIRISDLRGQVVVLNFWATWCGPCKKELPLLDGYYRETKRYGLRVFALTTQDSVPEYALHSLFDKMTIEPVHRLTGPYAPMEGLPTNYVIDRAGVVRYAKAGAFDLDALNTLLIPLLKEPPPVSAPPIAAR